MSLISSITWKEKQKLIKKQKKCVYCGCDNALYLTVDHIRPLSRGGADCISNCETCCVLCNQLKSNRTKTDFIVYLRALKALKGIGQVWIDFREIKVKVFNKFNSTKPIEDFLKK